MIYRVIRRIFRRHALFHLFIPLIVGVSVEVLYTFLFDRPEWQNLTSHLLSGPRIALYVGIVLAYLVVIGILIRKETQIGLRQLDLHVLADNLKDAQSLFAIGTMKFDEWFDPIVQVYLATTYERQLRGAGAQFRYERILLLDNPSARRDLGSDYLDGYLAKCLIATHKRLHVDLYFLEWHDIAAILNQLTPEQKASLKYYPSIFAHLPDWAAKSLMPFIGRRRRVRKLAIGLIETNANSKFVFRFSKRDKLLSVRFEQSVDAGSRFVELIRKTIYKPIIAGQPSVVKPQYDFTSFY